jgi:GNAT superfamily N-acetyltransferase
MISELEATAFERVRPLLQEVQHNLTVAAVAEGTCPGRIWVDNAAAPRSALVSTPEGHFLVGQRPEGELAASLKELITDTIYARGRAEGWLCFPLHYPDPDWKPVIADLVAAKCPVWDHQQYFVLKHLRRDWRAGFPDGFSLQRVDRGLLERADLTNVQHLRGWATGNFGSLAGFLEHGFGFCITRGSEIVSWCLSDCVSGCCCEIGIHTAEGYRRQGLAARTVAAAVGHCLASGLTHVGWHCWSSNLASAATARAAGFEKVLDHYAVQVWFNEFDGLLVNGNLCLLQSRYADAAEWYEKAFAMAAMGAPDVEASAVIATAADWGRYYHKAACAWALAGNREAAVRCLDRAIDTGGDRWRLF